MKLNKEEEITKKLYGESPDKEWKRLHLDEFHRLEYDGTIDMLDKYLPKKGLILDAGGGPGRYSIYAAERGNKVVLLDIAEENLKLAKEKASISNSKGNILSYVNGTIADLSMFDNSVFDAVICLGGPLANLHPEKKRLKALEEFSRVAKRNAPIIISVMSYYGVMLATPAGWPKEVGYREYHERFVNTGDDYRFAGSGYCHFFKSDELRKLADKAELVIIDAAGLECLNVDMETSNKFMKEFPVEWKKWKEINERMKREQFVIDASGHFIMVFRNNSKK